MDAEVAHGACQGCHGNSPSAIDTPCRPSMQHHAHGNPRAPEQRALASHHAASCAWEPNCSRAEDPSIMQQLLFPMLVVLCTMLDRAQRVGCMTPHTPGIHPSSVSSMLSQKCMPMALVAMKTARGGRKMATTTSPMSPSRKAMLFDRCSNSDTASPQSSSCDLLKCFTTAATSCGSWADRGRLWLGF